MAEFKKEPPKDEVIISELKSSIVNALTDRLTISVEAQPESLGVKATVAFGDKNAVFVLSTEDLQSLDAIEKIYAAGKEIASKL